MLLLSLTILLCDNIFATFCVKNLSCCFALEKQRTEILKDSYTMEVADEVLDYITNLPDYLLDISEVVLLPTAIREDNQVVNDSNSNNCNNDNTNTKYNNHATLLNDSGCSNVHTNVSDYGVENEKTIKVTDKMFSANISVKAMRGRPLSKPSTLELVTKRRKVRP